MKNLLFVHSSFNGEASQSRKVAGELIDAWKKANPTGQVSERTLSANTFPHLTQEAFGAAVTPADKRTEQQKIAAALADAVIEEVEAADTIVITAPMYNFSIPSTLKAWLDHLARAGRTFRYTDKGPQGLLTGKKVYVVIARAGVYTGESPAKGMNFQEPYLRTILGFVGITDVTFIELEGLAMGPEAVTQAFDHVREQISAIAA